MDIPKEIKTYCKKCNLHTVQKLKQFKPGQARTLAWGTRENIRKHKKGYGGKAEFTATVKKQTKKPTFIAECTQCKAKHYFVIPKRMKKVDIAAA
jgi:large subunit ribosomal protein L44e